jgi:hypothetical protein
MSSQHHPAPAPQRAQHRHLPPAHPSEREGCISESHRCHHDTFRSFQMSSRHHPALAPQRAQHRHLPPAHPSEREGCISESHRCHRDTFHTCSITP